MLRTTILRPAFHSLSTTPRLVPVHPAFRTQLRLNSTNPPPPTPKTSNETEPGPSQPNRSEKITSSNVDAIAEVRERVQQWSTRTATAVRQQIDQYTANLARSFSQLGKEINKVTGYGEIEELKRLVVAQGELGVSFTPRRT